MVIPAEAKAEARRIDDNLRAASEARAKVEAVVSGKAFTWTRDGMVISDEPAAVYYDARDVLAYAAACVAEALQPRDPSPELAEAVKWLESAAEQRHGKTKEIAAEMVRLRAQAGRLAAEAQASTRMLDSAEAECARLRAENAALRGEAERTVYVSHFDASSAIGGLVSGTTVKANEPQHVPIYQGGCMFEVRISARRIDGSAK
jgi:hypothetical protein